MGGNPGSRHALILLAGLPGAGKTTFATRLAERLGAIHVESDAIRHRLVDRPRYTRAEHHRVFAAAEDLAREGLRDGRLVVVDATNLDERSRRRFLGLARREAVPVIGVRLTAPVEVLEERLRGPRVGYSSAGPEVLARMLGRLEPFTIPAVIADSRYPFEPSLELVRLLVEDRADGS